MKCFDTLKNLHLTRYDLMLMFGIYLAVMLMRSSNFSFPLYANITPDWICTSSELNETGEEAGFTGSPSLLEHPVDSSLIWSKNCTIYNACPKEDLRYRAPFYGSRQEFGLVCDYAYQGALISSVQFVGVLIGTNSFSYVSDLYGRVKILAIVGLSEIIMGFSSSFANGPVMLAVLRFFTGFFGGGGLVVTTVFMLESIKPEQRIFMRAFVSFPTIKFIIILINYLCRDWRDYMRISNLMGLYLPFLLLFLVPESVKWANDRGKTDLAKKSQKRIDWINGKKTTHTKEKDSVELAASLNPSSDVSRKISEKKAAFGNSNSNKSSLRELLASKQMRIETCVLCMMWLTTATTGYTIGWDSRNLAGDFYVNQVLLGLLGLLSNIVLFLLDTYVPRFNRRMLHQIPQLAVIICSSIAFICLAVGVEGKLRLIITASALMASFFCGYMWDCIYLSTGEIFPTQFRASAYGICNIFARLGVILTPQIVLLRQKWAPGPYLIIAVLGCISLALSYKYLPDTKGKELPSNVEEADEMANVS